MNNAPWVRLSHIAYTFFEGYGDTVLDLALKEGADDHNVLQEITSYLEVSLNFIIPLTLCPDLIVKSTVSLSI